MHGNARVAHERFDDEGFQPFFGCVSCWHRYSPGACLAIFVPRHHLKGTLDGYQVYSPQQVDELSRLFIGGAPRDALDPILDVCVHNYINELDEDGQVDFKGKAKAFVRAYQVLASILPYTVREWEELSTFLSFLVPKAPGAGRGGLVQGYS